MLCKLRKNQGTSAVLLAAGVLAIHGHRISFTDTALEKEVFHREESGRGGSGWEWHCCCKPVACSDYERDQLDTQNQPAFWQNVRSNGDLICCTWDWSYFRLCPASGEFHTSVNDLLRNNRDGCSVTSCQGQYGVKKFTSPRVSGSTDSCDCEAGFLGPATYKWETNSWSACQAVPCPEHAHGHPQCECQKGYQGRLTWNRRAMTWAGSCAKKDCPRNSENWPSCTCKHGSKGSISWDGGEYIGECKVECPENALPEDASGSPRCICRKGFKGFWSTKKNTQLQGHCVKVECPYGASGHPHCRCNKYFSGELVWNGAGYHGMCVKAECPKNSGTVVHWPKCDCNMGYTGKVQWSKKHQHFFTIRNGKLGVHMGCLKVQCPDNSASFPSCRCLEGFVGEISWISTISGDGQYLGKCTQVACPKHSEGHPRCHCKQGYNSSTPVAWNGSAYIGECVSIA